MSAFKDYRFNDIRLKLDFAGFFPLDVMVVGPTGVGKSSTLNSIFEKDIAKVGNGAKPETMDLDSYYFSDKGIRFWDTPGLGDGPDKDIVHAGKILDMLYEKYYQGDKGPFGFIDLVIVLIDSSSRDIGTILSLLSKIILPSISKDRILIVLNKCDIALDGKGWDYVNDKPNEILIDFLKSKALSISERIFNSTGVHLKPPIYYSAEFSFNIIKLLDFIIDNIPSERRQK